ncbi:MAG TPA: S8 family serine peptidase, partial [Blastocatellia bacterium]|nr:S8 family serine peptidase [Blastocatellia bacterium]
METLHINCPVCRRDIKPNMMAPPGGVDDSIRPLLSVNTHRWEPGKEICADCVGRYERLRDDLDAAFPEFAEQEKKVIPTPMRLEAPSEYRGRGVTIAFLDAGFYAHPDLTRPHNRILRYVNLIDRTRPSDLTTPKVSSWHGMMTSVVAAGNGYLSNGLYRGIASEANLALVRIGISSRVRHRDIARGLRWAIRNRERYNIRIVN